MQAIKTEFGPLMAFAELVAFLKAQEKSPIDRLHELYRVYGYHVDDLENQVYPERAEWKQ